MKRILFIIFLLFFTNPVAILPAETDPPISIVYNQGIAPIKFTDDNGKPSGILNDYWKLLARKTGLTFTFLEVETFGESLDLVKNGEVDLHAGIFHTEERSRYLQYSEPILKISYFIYSTGDIAPPESLEDTRGLVLGVVQGGYSENYIKKIVPSSHLAIYRDFESLFEAVLGGELKVFISSDIHLNYYLSLHNIENRFKRSKVALYEQTYYGATAKKNSRIMALIKKSQQQLDASDTQRLRERWLNFKVKDSLEPPLIQLTREEQKWIHEHTEITLGADYKWPPFEFEDENGRHAGLASSYVKLIQERTGLNIRVQSGIWSDILGRMKRGDLDGLACAVKTDERTAYLNFSRPYLSVPSVIIVNETNLEISDMKDLEGKTVSVNNGSYMHDWLNNRHPEINLHLSTSNEASLQAVSYGEADAYIGNLAVANYILRKHLLTNLRIVKKLEELETRISIAIDKDKPILMGIIQKALNSVSDHERQAILDTWYLASTRKHLELTREERRWLQENPVLRLSGDPTWAPVSYVDKKGSYVGIVPDYFKLIEAKSGLHFEVNATENWSATLAAMQDGGIDVIDAITPSPERGKLMNFTDAYLTFDIALITRNDIKFIKGLDYAGRRRVGTVKAYITESYIRADHPEIDLTLYDTAAQGLKALANGGVDIFVIDIPSFEYYAENSLLANLKISGLTQYSFSLAIGVKKNTPELVSILNKTLVLLSQKERNDIYDNWVTLDKPLVDYSLIWKVLLGAFFLFALFGYWNRRLTNEVRLRKTAEIKALQASRAKSDFLANMSHEIRTPMNSVLGFAELLDNMITDPIQKSYLKSIRSGGKSLLGIINDILDLSKIEAGKMTMNPEPLSMIKLFDEIKDFFKNRMAQKQLEFFCTLPEDFPPYILIDGIRLRQILMNLLGNALKFTNKGSIVLSCQTIKPNHEMCTVDFTLVVSDTGIGIPEQYLQQIFDKFEQKHGQDAMQYGGTGLGLSICKNLMEMMGGKISVKSTVDVGSSFILEFRDIPQAQDVLKTQPPEHLAAAGFQEGNVLVADDVEDNRELIIGQFQGSGLTFRQAENGKEALCILAGGAFSLVFLDLRMPVMNGYETITQIRQDRQLKNIPVIAITASVMGEDLHKVRQYGFDDYLRKPIERQDLLRVAAEHLAYQPFYEEAPPEISSGFADVPAAQIAVFIEAADGVLMPEWQNVKDKGDFELTAGFAEKVITQAAHCSIPSIVDYGQLLAQNIESFEIMEVDNQMKKFPEIINALKMKLAEEERADD